MTLLDMANKEDVSDALKTFNENKSTILPLLDDYLKTIAATGKTGINWELLKPLIIAKFEKVLDDWVQIYPINTFPNHFNGPDKSFVDLRALLAERLIRFENAPYTIQRICELLIEPKRYYIRPDTFLRALQKLILVVSVIDPEGFTIYSSESLNREPLVQDSPTSRLSGEDESFEAEEQGESDMDLSVATGTPANTNHPLWVGTTRPPIGFNSPATIRCLKQQAEREGLLSNPNLDEDNAQMDISDEELDVQKLPITPNVPPIDQMLRPIGQLEAFVQNLAPAATEPRNVSSALLSPLVTGSTLNPIKPNLINYGGNIPPVQLQSHAFTPATEPEPELAEPTDPEANDASQANWNRGRKRDSSTLLEDENELAAKSGAQPSEEAPSSPKENNQEDQVPLPSPCKMTRIEPTESDPPAPEAKDVTNDNPDSVSQA